jgi:hypothetical protein
MCPRFIAALVTIAKFWKQPRCPMTDEWIKKMWYIDTMEFYSAIKKNGIMMFAGKWMGLENIMLSKVSQVQKVKGPMFSPYVEARPKVKCVYKYIYDPLSIYLSIVREKKLVSLSEGIMGGRRGKGNVRE